MGIPEHVDTEEARTEAAILAEQLDQEWVYLESLRLHPADTCYEYFTYRVAPGWLRLIIELRNFRWFRLFWWLCEILVVGTLTLYFFSDLSLTKTLLIVFLPTSVLLLDKFYKNIITWHHNFTVEEKPLGLPDKYKCLIYRKIIAFKTYQIIQVYTFGDSTHHIFIRA
ncbi:MAG: hypothetical protein H6779_03175 [Candidatus Nomurabacteria bacterium]|nr:MAG: hypothetical protein H6779_03175 [Candidatus Nomurabacteria bacterium]